MTNVTGWNELINGSLLAATNSLYTFYFGDLYIALLFIGFKIMLYFTTDGKSPFLMLVSTLIMLSLFYTMISPLLIISIVSVGIVELAMTLYSIAFK